MCPSCAAAHESHERFCLRLRAPARHARARRRSPPRSELAERARKVHQTYAEGPLVRAAWARNQAEAELIQGLLLEEGIPSLARRSGGFDVPDFLAAGPRDILVAAVGWTPPARSSATRRRRGGSRPSATRPGCARWPSRSPSPCSLAFVASVAVPFFD